MSSFNKNLSGGDNKGAISFISSEEAYNHVEGRCYSEGPLPSMDKAAAS